MLTFVLVVIWIGTAGSAVLFGLDYYLLPLPDRAFSSLASLYAPTGLVGQGMGVVGSAFMIVGVSGYTARKRLSFLQGAGALRDWLKVHIFLCTLGPFLVLLHTTFKFGGIVSIAVEAALALAEQPGNEVRVSYRKNSFSRIKPANHERVQEALNGGMIDVLWSTTPKEIRPDHVELIREGHDSVGLPADQVFVFIGGELPTPFLRAAGVEIETHFGAPR